MKKFLLSLLCLASLGASAQNYELVTEVTEANLGTTEYILLGYNATTKSYQAAGTFDTKYFGTVNVTVDNNICDITNVSGVEKFTLVAGTETNSYAIKTSDGKFVNFTGTSNQNMTLADAAAKSASFTLAFSDGGNAEFVNCSYVGRGLKYNASNPRFTNYSTTFGTYAFLYKLSSTAAPTVAKPVFSVAAGNVEEGTDVEITCSTDGAKIYYTLDGTTPDNTSTEYTAAIVINKTTTVKAIAYVDTNASAVATATYTVVTSSVDPQPGNDTVTFDFTGDTAYGMTLLSSTTTDYNPDPTTCVENPVTLTLNGQTRWWKATNNNELRFYKDSSFTLSTTGNYYITNVDVTATTPSKWDNTTFSGNSNNVTFTTNITKLNTPITKIVVKYVNNDTTSLAGIEAEAGEAVYYNLQGVRVDNPIKGLYIRVANGKSSKVVR